MPASVTPSPNTGGFTVPPVSPLSEATARNLAGAQTGSTGNTHAPSSNTAAVITKTAAAAGIANVVSFIAWGYSGTPTAGSLKVEDGSGTVIFGPIPITAAGPGFFPVAIKGSAATALIVTLAAGGSGVSGVVSVASAWTELA